MSNDENFIPDDFEVFKNCDISFDGSESNEWSLFIDQILQGNVIPVIGPEILCDKNPHRESIHFLARKLGIQKRINSFSELINDPVYLDNGRKKDYIYTYVNRVIAQTRFQPSELLREILSIRQFRFVITTSFTPVVENVMRDIWGDKLRVMRFNNNPRENQDIVRDRDLNKPTVYYMFGRAGDSAHRYVITDTDMLDFCSSWVVDTNGRPKNLVSCLKDKYLLMLGNSYSDWLFRFIWYSLRKSGSGNGLYAYETVEDELSRFLQRNQTFLQHPTGQAVEIMRTKLAERLARKPYETNFNQVDENVDIFISYARIDTVLVEKLYEALTRRGKRVWYDRNDISDGGKFMDEIRYGIRTAKYFVPILTNSIVQQVGQSHVYRLEWNEAIQVATSMGRTYLLPVCQQEFDFYGGRIPDKLQQYNAIEFDNIDDMEKVADRIVDAINKDKRS